MMMMVLMMLINIFMLLLRMIMNRQVLVRKLVMLMMILLMELMMFMLTMMMMMLMTIRRMTITRMIPATKSMLRHAAAVVMLYVTRTRNNRNHGFATFLHSHKAKNFKKQPKNQPITTMRTTVFAMHLQTQTQTAETKTRKFQTAKKCLTHEYHTKIQVCRFLAKKIKKRTTHPSRRHTRQLPCCCWWWWRWW